MAQAAYSFQSRDGVWRGFKDSAASTLLTAIVRRVNFTPVFTLYADTDLTTPITNTYVSDTGMQNYVWHVTLDV